MPRKRKSTFYLEHNIDDHITICAKYERMTSMTTKIFLSLKEDDKRLKKLSGQDKQQWALSAQMIQFLTEN